MRNVMLDDTRKKIKELEHRIENKEYASWGGESFAEASLKSLKQKERVLSQDPVALDAGKEELKDIWSKLQKIEAKEKCLRVQFLDWASDKLLDWSNRVHVMSSKIDSPCLIEVAPRKKEDSNHAKESKEIKRLTDLLVKEQEKNGTYIKMSSKGTV